MSDIIFQVTELATRRTEVVEAAKSGGARLRHKDGTSLVMLPESRLDLLEQLADWSTAAVRLTELLNRPHAPSVSDLGALAWLRVFDHEDLREFVDELHTAVLVAHADNAVDVLADCIAAWRTTARQLEDPLRRGILRGELNADDLVEAAPPNAG